MIENKSALLGNTIAVYKWVGSDGHETIRWVLVAIYASEQN